MRTEGQEAKLHASEKADEFFQLFIEGYEPGALEELEYLEEEDEALEDLLESFEIPHEADEIFNWLTGEYKNVE